MLPKNVDGLLSIGFDETIWYVTYGNSTVYLEESMKMADALAKMLIYLIEKGIVKP